MLRFAAYAMLFLPSGEDYNLEQIFEYLLLVCFLCFRECRNQNMYIYTDVYTESHKNIQNSNESPKTYIKQQITFHLSTFLRTNGRSKI